MNGTPSRTPPCCADAADGVCPQHEQARQLHRRDGPRARSRGQRIVGEPGKARPAPEAGES